MRSSFYHEQSRDRVSSVTCRRFSVGKCCSRLPNAFRMSRKYVFSVACMLRSANARARLFNSGVVQKGT